MSANVLDISKVVCYVSEYEGSSLGYGMVTFNSVMTVKFSIMRAGSGNLFVAWPSRKKNTGDFVSLVTFDDQEARNSINNYILKEFNKKLNLSNGGQGSNKPPVVVTTPDSSGSMPAINSSPSEPKKKQPVVKWRSNKSV